MPEDQHLTDSRDPSVDEDQNEPLLESFGQSVTTQGNGTVSKARYWILRLLLIMALSGWIYALLVLAYRPSQCRADSLADLALQHVLDDAAQIFGTPAAASATHLPTHKPKVDPERWMARYPDWTPLTHLTIPGAHDAATWNFSSATRDSLPPDAGTGDPAYFRTQRASIAASLAAGVRFYDLRYALDPTGTTLVFWHHNALLSEAARVADVLFAFYAWLDAHPTETVLLSFQYEGGTVPGAGNDARVQQQLFDALTGPAARRYVLQTRGELGSLGAARGKAVLLRRFDLDRLPAGAGADIPGIHLSPALWPDDGPDFALTYNADRNLTAYIEDYYEPDDLPVTSNASVVVARKLAVVEAHLRKAAAQLQDSLFITFTSAEYNIAVPPVFPEIMALGNGSAVTPLGGVNQQLVPILASLKGKRLGVVVVDYWDEPTNLIDTILGL